MDSSGSGYGPVDGSCERDNEHSGSMQGRGGISVLAELLSASQELFFMELVN